MRSERWPDVIAVRRSSLAYPFAIAAFVAIIGYSLFATLAPIWEFDYLADWGAKGRTFWEARGVDWAFLDEPKQEDMIHADYPLLLPLAFDALAVIRGRWTETAPGVFNVLFARWS